MSQRLDELRGQLLAALDEMQKVAVEEVTARLQPQIDSLTEQVEELTRRLWELEHPMLVGARAKEATGTLAHAFFHANEDIGPLRVTRAFNGALPATHVPITPEGVVEIVSYKSSTAANVASFAASMRPGTLVAYHHEPEADYPAGGAAFVAEFNAEAAKWARVGVMLGMISGGYQWRAAGKGRSGSYLPAATVCGWYGFDTYRDGSSEDAFGAIVPLTQVDEFQAWHAAVKGRGRPLLVTEYGRGTVGGGEVASTPAKRAAAITADGPYLESLGFTAWCAWYSDLGPDGRAWRFTDAASVNAWKAQCAER